MAASFTALGWKPGLRLLVYGIGNPGRQDDGLGPLLVERLGAGRPEGVELEANYQLNVEDALLVAGFPAVLFVDASAEAGCAAPFTLCRVQARAESAFTSHAMSPGAVLALARDLYGKEPEAFLCAIPGYSWEVNAELSPEAGANLEAVERGLRELWDA